MFRKLNKQETQFAIVNGLNPLLLEKVTEDWESYTFYHTKKNENL